MTDTTDQQAVTVALSKQLEVATDIGACFCIGCGQPDEPELHDPARCPAREGGELAVLTVADALKVFDTSCDEEPDLDGDPRALHCAIVAARLASVSSASAEVSHAALIKTLSEFHRIMSTKFDPTCMFGADYDRKMMSNASKLVANLPAVIAALSASPKPVPATNQAREADMGIPISHQAGEAEAAGRNLYLLQGDNSRMADALRKCRDQFAFYAREHYAAGKSDKGDTNTRFADIATKALEAVKPAALATQPATSQEGEEAPRVAAFHAIYGPNADLFENPEGYAFASDVAAAVFAATPTPPTLSEDLREAIARIVCEIVVQITCAENATEPSIQAQVDQSWQYWTDTADRILALAQVSA